MTNLSSPRARQRNSNPMRDHDSLPEPLRRWAAQAALPWSARSLRRLWARSMQETKCQATSLARLSDAEHFALKREAALVWGRHYPQ